VLKFLKRLIFDPEFQRKTRFLRSLDIFKELSGRELGLLAHELHTRAYEAGEVIFVEGEIGRALFILETGKVELTKLDSTGKPRTIYTVAPGDFFGEMALLEQLPRSASAAASERCRLHLLYRANIDALLSSHPRIGATIMAHLARLLSSRLRLASNLAMPEALPPRV
jgi:CRP-like cAMP-binding protein